MQPIAPSAAAIAPSAAAKAPALAVSAAAMLGSVLASLSAAAPAPAASRRTATETQTAPTATASTTTSTTSSVEAEKMSVSGGSGKIVSDSKASGRKALALVGSGTASTTVTISESNALTIRARAASGSPTMTVSVDGVPITTVVVNSASSYATYTFAGTIAPGTHVISVSSSTATSTSPLYLDTVSTTTGPIGDQFSGKAGSAPNATIWTPTIGTGWDPGVQNYVASGAYLDGTGHLVLQATKTSSGGWTSGRVQTANNLSLGYGTITARILVPSGQGLWPAFWLMGADSATTGWPQAGEIDVMELPSTTTTMYSTLHGPIAGTTATQQAQVISNLPDLSTGYHDYWVTHLPDQITFGVDNMTLGTLTPADLAPGETWVYNRPQYVLLNLAVGGSWAGAPDSTTPSTAQMIVDSVTWTAA